MDNITFSNCIFCKSTKVIKHGKTSTGNPRFRCRVCNKTWVVEKNEPERPDLADVTVAYLGGRTCRDLVSVYHSSPLRINQKIREFLNQCPHWEEYIDSIVQNHEVRIIYLIGRSFSCATKGSHSNSKFLALAVDALSTVILGYEIDDTETQQTWQKLLERMKKRNINCPSFMSNGSRLIEDSVHATYPNATVRINYHRAYRDKELMCCIYRLPINNKLLNDAVKIYNSLDNRNLNKYLKNTIDKKLQDILFSSQEEFIRRVKERLENKTKIRIEGLTTSFQARFEKFHMLKDDPYPLINGWVADNMLKPLHFGFSRLSLYSQSPIVTSFKKFSMREMPEPVDLTDDTQLLKTFVIEVAARGLQLPVIFNSCEMKSDKCSLF
ncbi:MAG: hypothetical protein HW421_994 [Ignavibacteria bacterium]|nr:hypothetical protein [Ignavibacteria bacterium]